MSTYALTGDDTVIINDLPVNDYADNTIGTLEIPNDMFAMSTGKNGNTIFALDEKGNNATLTLRVLMSSNDDKRFNGMVPQSRNFASTVLANGSVIKQVGDGAGNISYNTYMLRGGMISKKPQMAIDVAGDTNQSVVEYTFQFASAERSIT